VVGDVRVSVGEQRLGAGELALFVLAVVLDVPADVDVSEGEGDALVQPAVARTYGADTDHALCHDTLPSIVTGTGLVQT
jgi:hypothetical protein